MCPFFVIAKMFAAAIPEGRYVPYVNEYCGSHCKLYDDETQGCKLAMNMEIKS